MNVKIRMSQIRSFIAIELPPQIKARIEEIQNKLKSSGSDVRWTRPEGIHLTLKFLGNVEQERIPEMLEDFRIEKELFFCKIQDFFIPVDRAETLGTMVAFYDLRCMS